MKINFNCLNLSLSGGNRFIFELSNRLIDRGHIVTLTHAGLPNYLDWFKPVKAKIIQCEVPKYIRLFNKVKLRQTDLLAEQQKQLLKNMPICDVNVATFWATVKPTFESRKGKPYYLVQHYEPLFYDDDVKLRKLAQQSYSYPLKPLCVSEWLCHKVNGTYIGNGINLQKYTRLLDVNKTPQSVFVSYRSQAYKNTSLLARLEDALTLQGFTVLNSNENLTDSDMIKLYNESEVYVNLSGREGFGYGPLEAMACGCAVVSTPCSEYFNKNNSVLVPFNSPISKVVEAVKNARIRIEKLSKEAKQTVLKYDFENVVDLFMASV